MNPFTIIASFGALILLTTPSWGQIKDDEESYNLLATQCLISARKAGRNDVTLADYDKYANSLAKVLSILSPEQQYRVFGTVSGGALSAEIEPIEEARSLKAESASSGFLSDMGDAIVGAVGDFNDFMSGEEDTAAPVMGALAATGSSTGDDVSGVAGSGSDTSGSTEGSATVGAGASGSAEGSASLGSDTAGSAEGSAGVGSDTAGSAEGSSGLGSDTSGSAEGSAGVGSDKSDFDFWAFLAGLVEGAIEYYEENHDEEDDRHTSGSWDGGSFGSWGKGDDQ